MKNIEETKKTLTKYKRLLVINDHGIFGGGTEKRIRTLIIKFIETSFFDEVHVIQKFPTALENHDALPASLKNRLFVHTLGKENSFFKTLDIITKHSIDFVQCHNLAALSPLPILAAKINKKPIIFYGHDYWPICGYRSFVDSHSFTRLQLCETDHSFGRAKCLSIKAEIKYWFWKRIINICTAGIATGKNMAVIYEKNKILRGKWHVITPWIDPFFFQQKETNQINKLKKRKEKLNTAIPHSILFVGSLLPFKGAFVAVQSMKHITKRFPDTKLLLVGSEQEHDSRYRIALENIARRDNTLTNILFLGKKKPAEIQLLHRTASAFIFPTLCMESFGQSWAEAMADRCPVIVTAISTLPEYVKNNKNGFLVPPNDPTLLAKTVITLFQNHKHTNSIAQNGAKYAKNNFSLNLIYPKIFMIYSKV